MTYMFQLDPELPPVTVVQRKHQRTMRVRVNDNQIIVSGPATVSRNKLIDFVVAKSDWIRKSCEKRRLRSEQQEEKRKQHKGTLLLRGERKNIYSFPVMGLKKPRLVEHRNGIIYQFNPSVSGKINRSYASNTTDSTGHTEEADVFHPKLSLVHAFYQGVAQRELCSRFSELAEQLPFRPAKFSIRNQKTKWGSCSSRGTITLNWRLVKCPTFIMDYIIIHELCHLQHFNHSKQFWNTVDQYFPNHKQARSWIRTHTDEIFADI